MRYLMVKTMFLALAVGLSVSACTNQPNDGNNNRVNQQGREDRRINTFEAHTNEPVSAYGQFGKVGMGETRKRYPNAEVTDYQHIGRQAAETFRYQLRQNGRQWTVHAIVTFDPQTNQVISVDLLEEK